MAVSTVVGVLSCQLRSGGAGWRGLGRSQGRTHLQLHRFSDTTFGMAQACSSQGSGDLALQGAAGLQPMLGLHKPQHCLHSAPR